MADIIITTTINDLVSVEAIASIADTYGYQAMIKNPVNPLEMIPNPESDLDFIIRKQKEETKANVLNCVTQYRTKNTTAISVIVAQDYNGKIT